jgi:hypothetical protein
MIFLGGGHGTEVGYILHFVGSGQTILLRRTNDII